MRATTVRPLAGCLIAIVFALVWPNSALSSVSSEAQRERFIEYLGVGMEMAMIEEEIAAIQRGLAAEFFFNRGASSWKAMNRSEFQSYIASKWRFFKRSPVTDEQMRYIEDMYLAESEQNKRHFSKVLKEREQELEVLRSRNEELEKLMREEPRVTGSQDLGAHWACNELGFNATCTRQGRSGAWVCNWAGGCSDSLFTVRSFDPATGEILISRKDQTCPFSVGLTAEYEGIVSDGMISGERTIMGVGSGTARPVHLIGVPQPFSCELGIP